MTNSDAVWLEGSIKHHTETARMRFLVIAIVFSLYFLLVAVRLVDLSFAGEQRVEHHLEALRPAALKLARGSIVDRNRVIVATNLKTASMHANPQDIQEVEIVISDLINLMPSLDANDLRAKLMSNKQFVWIKHNLHPNEQQQVMNLGHPGLNFIDEERRTYPQGSLLSHLLGFVGSEGDGLAGIEKYYNKHLNNKNIKSNDLQLSIDMRVQDVVRRELAHYMKRHSAKGGAAIVMDVSNGEVISLVSLPDYNLNIPSEVDPKDTFNQATLGVYELGSIFKTFTFAHALDVGKIKISDTVDAIDPIKIGRYYIRDHHPKKRILSVPESFMYSSNIATARIADLVGGESLKGFFAELGFDNKLSIEVPESGMPLPPERWGRVQTMTSSYGHGIAVSPLHAAAAVSAMVNGGIYYPPTFIRGKNKEGKRVIKQASSRNMQKLLRLVSTDGTGRNADVDGYIVGGKTGTAEKAAGRGYSRKNMVTSFAGAFPMHDPKYAIMVMVDEPKGIKETYGYATAGYTAAPIAAGIVKKAAPILRVSPVDEEHPDVQKTLNINYEVKNKKYATIKAIKKK